MKKRTKIILGCLTGVLVLAAGFGLMAWKYVTSEYESDSPAWLYLPKGSTRAALADSLISALGDETSARVYKLYCAGAKDGTPIYGAYKIDPGTSVKEIAGRIAGRRETPVNLTFNNIRTLSQLADSVAARMDFTAEDFLEACRTVLPESGFTDEAQYPAAFLPDTYEVYWSSSADKVVKKMLDARNSFWTDERRVRAKELGLTPVQAATIASIAEEETNDPEERGTVVRLYLNRLDRNMLLQADPTVKFAVGDFSIKRVLSGHLQTDSPYNTYKYPGVPPGPIRIAERATIEKVLNAPANNYIYMCARPDYSGLHNFTDKLSEHNANARNYQRWLDSIGIK